MAVNHKSRLNFNRRDFLKTLLGGSALFGTTALGRLGLRGNTGAEPLAMLYEPVPDRYRFLLPGSPPPGPDAAAGTRIMRATARTPRAIT